MILADVRDYMAQRGRATLSDLCVRFGIDDDAMRPMLDHWVRKGRLRRLDTGQEGKCGSKCCACSLPEIYEWVVKADSGTGGRAN